MKKQIEVKSETTLTKKVWNMADVLAAAGVGFTDYIIQLTYLLFLKMDAEKESYGLGSAIPKGNRWKDLLSLDGPDLQAKYEKILETLKSKDGLIGAIFTEAINHPDVVAISVATRPDCLNDDILNLLTELNRIKPVWVELGLQTIHEKTANYIRRGYALSVYDEAVVKLHKRNLEVITHVILGLPGESKEEMIETVRYVCDKECTGIKLQLLHVLKGTDLAKDYYAGKLEVMGEEEYLDLIVELLKIIPENVVIHRLTGDGAKKDLIAPMWSANKKHVLNRLKEKLSELC